MPMTFAVGEVLPYLTGTGLGAIEYERVVTSTNDIARKNAENGAWGTVIVAEEQTAGRGRKGRRWFSPPGLNLTFSFPLEIPEDGTDLLPFVSAAALRAAVGQVAPPLETRVTLKWPNDVMLDGEKFSGTLVETFGTKAGVRGAVVGVGINVNMREQDLNPEWRGRVTSLAIKGGMNVDRGRLLLAFLRSFDAWFRELKSPEGRAELIVYVNRHSSLAGKRVRVTTGDETSVAGEVLRIDGFGALIVQTATGEVSIVSGDIELT